MRLAIDDRFRPRSDKRFLARVVEAALEHGGRRDLEVSLLLTDDRGIAALHGEFLGDPTPTDVMSFPAEGGADLILDMVGGDYIPRNVKALADDGRLVQIAFLSGAQVSLNFALLMVRRLTITGSTLRPQSDLAKARIAEEIRAHVWPMIAAGHLKPVMDSEFALESASNAHARMEGSGHIGKIVLRVGAGA